VWNRLQILEIHQILGKTKIAAIGPKTGLSLETRKVQPDFIPAEYTADSVAPGMGDLVGKRVLLPLGNLARETLSNAIRLSGGFPKVITAYNTFPEKPDPAGLSSLQSGVDAITFTSSSSAVNFVQIVQNAGLDPERLPGNPIYACIGPITTKSAIELGLHPEVIAAEFTVEGLINSLRIYYQGNKIIEKPK
jgi:uroporphyrinogen-III synthase